MRRRVPGYFWAALACAVAVIAGLFIPAHGIAKVPSLDEYAPTGPLTSRP